MKFNKIVAVDRINLDENLSEELKKYSDVFLEYNDYPQSDDEIVQRIADADCVLVSWNTPINKKTLQKCKKLKYVGMCCSLYDEKSANVDIKEARELGIKVMGVRDYADEGVVEFILMELIKILHGYGNTQWQKEELELSDQKIGIIGLGKTGLMVANALNMLGADVYYYSRTRNINEEKNIKYLEFDELLRTVDIISTHLPKNTYILDENKLKIYGNGKIIINTSIGATYEEEALRNWLEKENNYFICDKVSNGNFADLKNIIYTDKVSGKSLQSKKRLTEKVIANLKTFLNE